MNFLLDTNICSAHLKGNARVFNRFMQHTGGLAVSTVVVAELYTWVFRARTKPERLQSLLDLLGDVQLLDVDHAVAETFGRVRARLLDEGSPMPEMDLLIASTAIVHDLTLVTHNVAHFAHVPNLRIDDWLA